MGRDWSAALPLVMRQGVSSLGDLGIKCPGLFLPDRVLETFFRVLPSPLEDELIAVAFLPWISEEEAL